MLKKILYTLLFIAFCCSVQAQQKARLFTCAAKQGEKGVWIKFFTQTVISQNGFNIYRKEANAPTWSKLNAQALTIQKGLNESNFSSKELFQLYDYCQNAPYQDISQSLLRIDLIQNALRDNGFAISMGLMLKDATAEEGKSYQYRLTEMTASGEVELIVSQARKYIAGQALAPPAGFKATRAKKENQLTWTPEPERYFGVELYKKTNQGTFTGINSQPMEALKDKKGEYLAYFFTDVNTSNDSSYAYYAIAVDHFGEKSAPCATVELPAVDLDAPATPLSFDISTKGIEKKVLLAWEYPEKNDIERIEVYRAVGTDSVFTKISASALSPTTKNYEDIVPQPGSYTYELRAFDKAGNQSASQKIPVELRDVIPPAAPQNVSIKADTGFFKLKWKAVSDADLAGYIIHKAVVENGVTNAMKVRINTEPIKGTEFKIEMPKNVRNVFEYTVQAVDTNFNFGAHSEGVRAQLPDVTPPQNPVIIGVNPTGDSLQPVLTIEWIPNADADLMGYNLFHRIKGDTGAYKKVNFALIPKSVKSYAFELAEPGIRYEFRLQAIDENNLSSEFSNAYYGGLLKKADNIEARDVKVKLNDKKRFAEISWTAPIDPETVLGYYVFRAEGTEETEFQPVTGLQKLNEFKDKGLKAGTTYRYQVRVYSNTGHVAKSNTISITLKSNNNE